MIRQAKLNDLESIIEIEHICFPIAEAASADSLEKRLNVFQECFYVAEINNEVVGFINGCMSDENRVRDEAYENINFHNPDGLYQMVFGLDVLPNYQHQGIAKELMYTFIEISKKRHKKGILLTCKKHLIGFYEQFGFVNQGVSNSTHGDAVWYDMELLFN